MGPHQVGWGLLEGVLSTQSPARNRESGVESRRPGKNTAAVGLGPQFSSRRLESCPASIRLSTEPRLWLGAPFHGGGPTIFCSRRFEPYPDSNRPSIVPRGTRRLCYACFGSSWTIRKSARANQDRENQLSPTCAPL